MAERKNIQAKKIFKKTSSHTNENHNESFVITILRCLFFQVVVCLFTLAALSFVLNSLSDPDKFIPASALICAAVGGLTGGIVFKMRKSDVSPVSAMISGVVFTALMFLVSFAVDKNAVESRAVFKIVLALFPPVFAYFGGKMSGKSKKSRKRL